MERHGRIPAMPQFLRLEHDGKRLAMTIGCGLRLTYARRKAYE